MSLALVPSDAPVLRHKAKRIAEPASVRDLADQMAETIVAEGGVGLAAPQVGRAVRLFLTNLEGEIRAYVNPEITWFSDEKIWWEEGCLSLPRLLGQVERPKQIKLSATDLQGRRIRLAADDLLARVIQHEVDHLDGVLFPDRMTDLSQLRKLTAEEWDSRFENQPTDVTKKL